MAAGCSWFLAEKKMHGWNLNSPLFSKMHLCGRGMVKDQVNKKEQVDAMAGGLCPWTG